MRSMLIAGMALAAGATDANTSRRQMQEDCADISGDGTVAVDDLLQLLAAYGSSDAAADVNSDGTVDVADLLGLLAGYGSNCSRDAGSACAFSIYKFNLDPAGDNTGLRDWNGANSIQLAEISLFDASGTHLIDGLVCTNPDGNNPGGELPEHACNGLTSNDPNGCSGCANSGHKWLDFNKGDLVMTFPNPVAAATWDWQTANDAPARDPTKWTIEGSNNGAAWTVLDGSNAVNAFDTTAERYTWQGPFALTSAGCAGGGCLTASTGDTTT